MTTMPFSAPSTRGLLDELFHRQRTLTIYGILTLSLSVLAVTAQLVDPRMIDGVDVWAKPAKFHLSVAVFALTAAWFFGYVRPERRSAPLMKGLVFVLIVAATFELAYISWQAGQGLGSHFNRTTLYFEIMYAL